MALPGGARLGAYEIIGAIGAGGMGEVYRARDIRLGREVALKVLPAGLAGDPESLARFRREARALAALDHPAIVTVHSVEEDGGTHFLTMQLIEGQSLDSVIPKDGLPLDRFLAMASELAEAVEAAHGKGIVHRDLKPANIMVAGDGRLKVLDFGLAKELHTAAPADATLTSAGHTALGVVMGTPAYMSPEQVGGRPVHASSDIFSLGVIFYEMATGRRPFEGDSGPALMSSILRDAPPPPSHVRSGLSGDVDGLVTACLAKDADVRPSASELRDRLRRMLDGVRQPAAARVGRPRLLVAATLALAATIGLSAWAAVDRSRKATFVAEALPRIDVLAREGRFLEAYELARRVEQSAGTGRVPEELWNRVTSPVSVVSEPAGARVTLHPFGWEGGPVDLGLAPLDRIRVPRGAFHWRVELPGHLAADLVIGTPGETLRFDLQPHDGPDGEMVRIPGGEVRLWVLGGVKPEPSMHLGAYLIDRHEVRNREYARFVAAGGYTRAEFWTHAFVDGDRELSFRQAIERFKDSTGRPGPATWRLGSYPDGEENRPVAGLSWYEAEAYAKFAGKELPTIYHWYQADTAGDLQLLPGLVLSRTNHEGSGPRAVGAAGSMSAFGAIDMAGNVREWAANASDGGTRITLGGAWSDPAYLYLFPEARSPFDRSSGNGLRCMKRIGEDRERGAAAHALRRVRVVDRVAEPTASDAEYAIFRRFYERQRVPLEPRVEATDDSSPHWVRQRITYAAGYGGERLIALLYLPKSARPPYQVVIQMAGAAAFYRRSSATEQDIFGWGYAEYLLRGGRAVLIPLWKGSYERSDGFHPLQTEWPSYREHVVQWVSELRQSVDYLETRGDVDAERIGYQGISNGVLWGPLYLALEPRLRTGIFLLGGLLVTQFNDTPMPAEIDGFHYVPRVTVPVLMLNGRHDAIFPYETSQLPLFRLLGTPPDRKRHQVFPGGHSSFGWTNELIREGLDWLDRWFGPPVPAA